MATDMWTMINRELAKIERARGGASDTPYLDVISETMRYSKEDRAHKERKNLQRQKMMELQTEGWENNTSIDELNLMGNRLQKFRDKNKNMDDITLEYADLLQNKISNRSERIAALHTDEAMLEENKQGWLAYADSIVDKPLGVEDYDDISASIDQYVKMKQNMFETHADLLQLPQFNHIYQNLIGQDQIVNELLTEAKDQNLFSPYEHKWITDAMKTGDYSIIQDEKVKRLEDRKRDIDSFLETPGGLLERMDLYRRLQIISGGGQALIPEIMGDATMEFSLTDMGFVTNKDTGKLEASKDKMFGEEMQPYRDKWYDLVGVGGLPGQAELDVKEADKLYDKRYGNKFTIDKLGFENLYADPDKSSLISKDEDDDLISITDDDGFIDIDKGVDEFGWGEVGAISTAIGVTKYKQIYKGYLSGKKFMHEVGFFSEDDIAKMFTDKDAKNIMTSISNKTAKLNAIDRGANPAAYKKALIELTSIQTSAKNKLFPKFSGELVKAQKSAAADLRRAQLLAEDIVKGIVPATDPEYVTPKEAQNIVATARKELDNITTKLNNRNKGMTDLLKNPNKWNLWKMRAGVGGRQVGRTLKDLIKVGGKTFGKLTPLDAAVWAWMLGDKGGLNNYKKGALAGGTYYGAKQVMNWLSRKGGLTNALMNPTLQSKIAGYLINKAPGLALKMGLKAGAGIAGTAFTGGLGTAFSVAMAGWMTKDVYNLIQNVPEIKQYIVEYLKGDYDEE